MQLVSVIGMGVFFTVSLLVGVRLLLVGARTRQSPELLIGAGLLALGPLGFPAAAVSVRIMDSHPGVAAPMLAYAVAMLAIGGACPALFTWLVFRPHSAVAHAIVVSIPLGLALCWTLAVTSHGYDMRGRGLDTYGALAFLLRSASLAWASTESLRYWRMMKRRVPLGLAEPVTANRFLLWGIGIGGGALTSLIALVGTSLTPDRLVMSDGLNALISVVGLASAAAIFLGFLPPDRYRRFIEQRAAQDAPLVR